MSKLLQNGFPMPFYLIFKKPPPGGVIKKVEQKTCISFKSLL